MLTYDCIIIGGSYAGLSAALSLGRALRRTLVIDAGNPCNKHVTLAHNFSIADGKSPRRILDDMRDELKKYSSVSLLQDTTASDISKNESGFVVQTDKGESYQCCKLLFATGVKDKLPAINGFKECWGNTIIHCPFCHGFEMRDQPTAILANGDEAIDYAKLLRAWTTNLFIFINGKNGIKNSEMRWLESVGIPVEEMAIKEFLHEEGKLQAVVLEDDRSFLVKALYHSPPFTQQTELLKKTGCKTDKQGLIDVDTFHATSVKGIYAAGDCASSGRSIAQAVAAGSVAGIFIVKAIMHELSE